MRDSFSSDGYKKYLFDYRYGGAEWGFEIVARSAEEAQERLKALGWAKYQGEIHLKIPVPGAGLLGTLHRLIQRVLNRA